MFFFFFFFSSRRRHTRFDCDWSSDVCSSDLEVTAALETAPGIEGATPVNTPPFAGTAGWDAPTFTAEGQSAERAATNPRSEERRVGKECRCRWSPDH